jgi:predicted lipoprotein
LSTLTLLGMTGLVLSQACEPAGGDDTGEGLDSEELAQLLAAVGPQVVVPALEDFVAEMNTLGDALESLESSLQTADAADARFAAQVQWRVAMFRWQVLEVMQIGPAASSLSAVSGEDLRDEVYSWPTVNTCRVDQKTVEADWDDPGFFEANLVNAYGLDALEHVLFAGEECACPSPVNPVADGSWDALGAVGVAENRAAFGRVLAAGARAHGEALLDMWSPEGGDFSGQLAVSDAGSPYASRESALNAVFDALFYLETMTKDRKLAQPMGLKDCDDTLCLEDLEGVASHTALSSIDANLEGFQELFTGGEGAGMDDLLVSLGHSDLSEQILSSLGLARATLYASLEEPLADAIEGESGELAGFYATLSQVTEALKTDLVTVLALAIPSEASGDSD